MEPALSGFMNVFSSRSARPATLLAVLCLLAFLAPAVPVRAAGQPVTIKELCLMLRGGYTGDEVLRETNGRPLLEPIDAANEKLLLAAGADARLVNALRATHPALTGDQAAAARAQQAEIDERNLQARDASRAGLLAYYKQNVDTHLAERKDAALGKYAAALRGQLVTLTDGGLKPYDDAVLANKKLFAFYFAALTNPNCGKFTPQLVKFYQDFAPKHPAFEVVFVSEDRSAFNMENHMRQDAMPWPALDFDRRASQPDLAALGKEVVPRLVLIDGMGRIVSDSVVEGKYVGPQHVLDDLTHLAAAAGTP